MVAKTLHGNCHSQQLFFGDTIAGNHVGQLWISLIPCTELIKCDRAVWSSLSGNGKVWLVENGP